MYYSAARGWASRLNRELCDSRYDFLEPMKIQVSYGAPQGDTYPDAPPEISPRRADGGESDDYHDPLNSFQGSGVEIVSRRLCLGSHGGTDFSFRKQRVLAKGQKLTARSSFLRAVFQRCAYQLHKSSDDAQDQANKVKPAGVQPAIERRSDQPSDYRRRRKDDCQLGVVGHLHPRVLLFRILRRRSHTPVI